MKTRKFNLTDRVVLCIAAAAASVESVFAQDLSTTLNSVKQTAGSWLTSAIDVATVILAVVSVPMIVWGFIQRNKEDRQSNDKLFSLGISFLVVIGLLQILKAVTKV